MSLYLTILLKLFISSNSFLVDSLGSTIYKILSLANIVLFLLSQFQFSSVAQSCLTFCDPMNHSMPGLPVHHQLLESTQTHGHRVGDAIQPSHPLSSPSPPALNLSQYQGLFEWVISSHQVAKVLEFQSTRLLYPWGFPGKNTGVGCHFLL